MLLGMKYLLSLLLFLSLSISVNAQNVLRIMMDDHSEITVSIDGRDYKKVGKVLTFVDIPRGWHDLRVYEYIPYRDGGGRAKLIYTGRVRLKNGNITTCIVDARSGRMSMQHREMNGDHPAAPVNTPTQNHIVSKTKLADADLAGWQQEVEAIPTDIERLDWLKSSLAEKDFTTAQMKQMMKWLAFEDSSLELAKWGYDKVTDAHNYKKLSENFSLESSKNEFSEFLNAK